jgi:hypothetical protein
MADPVLKLRRTDVVGRIPTASDLPPGAIGYNIADKKIYARHDDPMGAVVQIAASVAQGEKADISISKNTSDTTPVNTIRVLTQAEYDGIVPKDANTIYFIKS